MSALPMNVIAMFVTSVVAQLVGVMLMPHTHGFTKLWPTLGCGLAFAVGLWMVARMIESGAALGILMPLLAAVIPIGAIAIGVVMFGETASWTKVAMLLFACGLVGAAAKFG